MERDALLHTLKYHLEMARNRMKKQADRKRREVEFAVDDLVFVKLRPYRQKTLARRRNDKLAPRFFGPYRVMARIARWPIVWISHWSPRFTMFSMCRS